MSKIFSKTEYNQAYRYSISLCNDPDEAFDLLHTSFEKLLKKGVDHLDNPKTYLFRIIRNEFIDRCRRRKKMNLREFHDETTVVQLDENQLENLIINKDEVSHILADIDPTERELLYLSVVEGYSITEISELNGTPRGTLLSKLHRLKLRIKNKFQANTAEKTG
jgi:RNA polymerase sigma-70 factor (ECF subfamily)